MGSFLRALDIITEQGEGQGVGTVETVKEDFQKEGSHYARFAELRYGRRYVPQDGVSITRETEADFFSGEEIAWPVVINTLAVPADGYEAVLALDPREAEVRKELDGFDDAYTQMLVALDTSWNGPVETWWPSLGAAVTQMDQMRVRSCFTIMRNQIPHRGGAAGGAVPRGVPGAGPLHRPGRAGLLRTALPQHPVRHPVTRLVASRDGQPRPLPRPAEPRRARRA